MAAELHSEIMYDILSRLPVKSLARFRCVSKQWCNYINDPYFETMHANRMNVYNPMIITFHKPVSYDPDTNSPCNISFTTVKEDRNRTLKTVRKNPPVMEFMSRKMTDKIVLGSCNGLLYSSQQYRVTTNTTLVVINPLRRECCELPPINTPVNWLEPSWTVGVHSWSKLLCVEHSCGLGFDESTNTFKMVCIMPVRCVVSCVHQVNEGLCAMVYVLGTDSDSWRITPQAPSHRISGEGVFANGCLHWLTALRRDSCQEIVRFDMKTEEFDSIKVPIVGFSWITGHLVELHGEVGFVYKDSNYNVRVWVLKEKGWVKHCEFEAKWPVPCIKVLGFWNENGDVLMTDNTFKRLFVYNLKGDSLYEAHFVAVGFKKPSAKDIRTYQSSLFSTRYSIKDPRKTGMY